MICRPDLLISERSENLVQELLSYKQKDVGEGARDFAADSTRYAAFTDNNRVGPSIVVAMGRVYDRKI